LRGPFKLERKEGKNHTGKKGKEESIATAAIHLEMEMLQKTDGYRENPHPLILVKKDFIKKKGGKKEKTKRADGGGRKREEEGGKLSFLQTKERDFLQKKKEWGVFR